MHNQHQIQTHQYANQNRDPINQIESLLGSLSNRIKEYKNEMNILHKTNNNKLNENDDRIQSIVENFQKLNKNFSSENNFFEKNTWNNNNNNINSSSRSSSINNNNNNKINKFSSLDYVTGVEVQHQTF